MTLIYYPVPNNGKFEFAKQREFPDGAGALHLPRSSGVRWARPAGQKARLARQKPVRQGKKIPLLEDQQGDLLIN